MKTTKFAAITVAVLLMGFLGKAQQAINVGLVQNSSISTDPINISQLQVEGKLFTQNSFLGASGTQITGSFTANARWNSMGNLAAGSQTLNGFRTQTDGRALVWGHSIPNGGSVSNSFIQWGGNNQISPTITPGDLEFRSFTNPTGASPDLRFTLRGADGTGLFGKSASLKFISPIIGTPETAQVEVNAVDNLTGIYRLGLGIYTQNNKSASFISEGDPNNIVGDITSVLVNASGGTNTNIGVQISSTPGAAFFSNQNYGIFSSASNASVGYGIYGVASNNFSSVGVFGSSSAFAQQNSYSYGVYGIATGGLSGSRAGGFFSGNLFYTGSLVNLSDVKLKKEIKTESVALTKLMQLRPVNYLMKIEEMAEMNLSKGLQHGFIAQEVEVIFPEMVTAIIHPNTDPKSKEKLEFKGVNYTMLIPLLTKAIQEQQVQIEALQKQLTNTKANEVLVVNETVSILEAKELQTKSFMLAQNIPNPFTSTTTIKYSVPEKNIAMIAVFDLNGRMLLQFPNLQGSSQVTINGSALQAGMYLYSLLVNGQEIITKKMILTK
ncbi:MAG: T9SS C-terminal target domain-containing protein [Sphingobacteriia bacterium]|nr:MAG: T9SS C-terminal target domain-containing protein [Sphingobacteriia bacterium]TAH09194.1 MAG: T9SS C-terminal target domain-containing protein [Sphingobacteriia bacterium]